jgi:CRP-like cAMP-binding protein
LLTSQPRTATVRAVTHCDLFLLEKSDFARALRDRPQYLDSIKEVAEARYNITLERDQVLDLE